MTMPVLIKFFIGPSFYLLPRHQTPRIGRSPNCRDYTSLGLMSGRLERGVQMPRGTRGLSLEQLRGLARHGAEQTLQRLRAEIIAIERTFPELALTQQRRAVRRAVATARQRTRTMSAAARKAVSERMKKYWAERKKARAGEVGR
jgi:hypothetical protein